MSKNQEKEETLLKFLSKVSYLVADRLLKDSSLHFIFCLCLCVHRFEVSFKGEGCHLLFIRSSYCLVGRAFARTSPGL